MIKMIVFRELVQNHISGQLKVAPEHISDRVLDKWENPVEVYMKNLLINIIV